MEFYSSENGFLEELLSLRTDSMESLHLPVSITEYYNNPWNFENCYGENTNTNTNTITIPPCSSSSFQDYSLPLNQSLLNSSPFTEFYNTPFGGVELSDSSNNNKLVDTPPFHQLHCSSMVEMEDEDHGMVLNNGVQNLDMEVPCKMEPMVSAEVVPVFNIGVSAESEKKMKKINGQPSKNLMAERRRRKRLNDRLSMLRSVVPKISKMDRTSILGDTIDYMKELLERINNLQEEMDQEGSNNQLSLMSLFKNVKPNEVSVRNSPKFDVERREIDTRIEICCGGKPGMLLSTVTTLEALGLEIQQCVISCFNDFSMQASCSEDVEQRGAISSEDIKQALFRNAGFGGRCL